MKFGAKLERKLTKQITERVTAQITERVTEQVTEQVLDGQRGTVVAAVRDRFGEAAAAQAQAFLAGIKSGDAVLAAHRWALTSRSRSELMDRLAMD